MCISLYGQREIADVLITHVTANLSSQKSFDEWYADNSRVYGLFDNPSIFNVSSRSVRISVRSCTIFTSHRMAENFLLDDFHKRNFNLVWK